MAKKLKGAAAASADIFDTIARGNTADTIDTEDTQDTQDTQRTPKAPKPEYYRFNLKMPLEYKDYLQAAAYRASSPTKTVTITEYICELVRADMEKNAE
ncbi:MAG TPA: hypothetical protein VFD34_02500 [Clostridia bacterium]|nr:hypothetical protein [Clostridia bacterium]